MSSKLLPNGAPSDHPLPSIGELNNQCQDRHTSEENAYFNAISSAVSTSDTSFAKGDTESRVSSSSTLTEMVPPKSSHSASKEFKLNPGAKVFCPSFANHRSVTPQAVPIVANVAYMLDNFPVVPIASVQPEVEICLFVPCSSLSVKFVPYGNLVVGSGIGDSQYSHLIIGHIRNKTQPVRYDGQHHHSIQAGPVYMQPNSQNEMDRQVPLMDKIDTKVDNAASDLKNTNLRYSRNFCIDIILLCIILGIVAYLYKDREDSRPWEATCRAIQNDSEGWMGASLRILISLLFFIFSSDLIGELGVLIHVLIFCVKWGREW